MITKIVFKVSLVIKHLVISAVLFSAIGFLISACASRDEVMTEQSGSLSAAPVPGERISDEGSVTPGAAGTSANVRW